jgi:hypothetical protein
MPNAVMPPVPPKTIDAAQAPNGRRQIRQCGLERRVKVIGHEAVVPALDIELQHEVAEERAKLSIVSIVEEDGHLAIAT